jgi:hypothetical protein
MPRVRSTGRRAVAVAITSGLLMSGGTVAAANAIPGAGTCWDTSQPGPGVLVPCTSPHTVEFVAVLDLPKKLRKKRTVAGIVKWAQGQCRGLVNDYVGIRAEHAQYSRDVFAGYELAKWDIYYDWPKKARDRWVSCAATASAVAPSGAAEVRAIDFSVAGAAPQLQLTQVSDQGVTYTLVAQAVLRGHKYPGADGMLVASFKACSKAMGTAPALAFGPDRKSWRAGDRVAHCWISTPAA